MLDVIIALVPALVAATVIFGYHVLINAFFSVLFCAASETLFCLIKSGEFNREGFKKQVRLIFPASLRGLSLPSTCPRP